MFCFGGGGGGGGGNPPEEEMWGGGGGGTEQIKCEKCFWLFKMCKRQGSIIPWRLHIFWRTAFSLPEACKWSERVVLIWRQQIYTEYFWKSWNYTNKLRSWEVDSTDSGTCPVMEFAVSDWCSTDRVCSIVLNHCQSSMYYVASFAWSTCSLP